MFVFYILRYILIKLDIRYHDFRFYMFSGRHVKLIEARTVQRNTTDVSSSVHSILLYVIALKFHSVLNISSTWYTVYKCSMTVAKRGASQLNFRTKAFTTWDCSHFSPLSVASRDVYRSIILICSMADR